MINFCKKIMCALVAAAVVLPTVSIGVYAAEIESYYADTDEIVLTYTESPDDLSGLSLVLDGEAVGINTAVDAEDDKKVVLTPESGSFTRDVVYTISDGGYSSDFMIKTLIDGINKEDVNFSENPKGTTSNAAVFLDADSDGKDELFCYNYETVYFNNNSASDINTTKNYTVKYDLSSYAITNDKTTHSYDMNKAYNVIVNKIYFNATSANKGTAMGGFQTYRTNWQPIKYLNDKTWTYDKDTYPNTTVAKAGLNYMTDTNTTGNAPTKMGIVLYDGGTSNIEVVQNASVSAAVKLKKIGTAGTFYINGDEKISRDNGTNASGYFIFGGGEDGGATSLGNTFIQIKNFVATTCVPVIPPEELIPQSYNGDRGSLTIEFNEAITGIKSGNITLTNGADEIPINVEMNGSTAQITPQSGEFPRDVVLRATISEGFGDDSYQTATEIYKDFKIETIQSEINEETFGKKSSNKVYKDGKVYFTGTYISPQKASPYLSEYSISFKLRPFFVESPTIVNNTASLYMRISFNNETAATAQSNKGSAWNFQNYEQFISHTNWKEADNSYATDWGHQYGQWADTGLPSRSQLVEVSFANNDVNFINDPTYEPVDVRISKSGNSGTMTIGNVTDTLTTLNDTGYFVIAQYQTKFSVVEISDFVMTVFREYSPVNIVGDTEATEVDAPVGINLYGVATGDIKSAVTLYDADTGAILDSEEYECTLSSDKTKLNISNPFEWIRGKRIKVKIDTDALGVEDDYWQSIQPNFSEFEFSVGHGDIYSVINNATDGSGNTNISVKIFNKTGGEKSIYMIAALYGEDSELIGINTKGVSISDPEAVESISVPNNGKTVSKVKIHMLDLDNKPYCEAAIWEVGE